MNTYIRGLALLFGAAFSICAAQTAVASSVEAKKDGVEVFAAADKAAAVLTKLKKGESITSSERSGMYWRVKLQSGQAGFVSVLNVKVKSDGESGGLNNAIREAVKAGRSSGEQDGSRSRSAVMGVRGLDDTSDTAMAGAVRPNLRAVYLMEDIDVSQEKLDQQADLVNREIEHRLKGR